MRVRHVDLQASNFNAILYPVDTEAAENDAEGRRNSWDGLSFITGLMCAIMDKKLSSAVGFRGICKKVLILMLVGVANILDIHVVGQGSALRGAVIAFYLSNEGLSLLENAAYIGLPIPDKLREILAQLHNREDKNDQGDAD